MMMAAINLHANSRKPVPGASTAGAGSDAQTGVGELKVLVVEDESVIGWALQSLLEDLGHNVVGVVASGLAAVQATAELRPELIMMDINLGGGLDGIEAAARILAHWPTSVIFVSAYGDDGTMSRIRERVPGAPLVTKPVSARSIETAIARAFGRHH